MALSAHAQASMVEIVSEGGVVGAGPHMSQMSPRAPAAPMSLRVPTAPREGVVVLQPVSSELAEPAVFAMMLLGLCLIGYRTRRDSSATFT